MKKLTNVIIYLFFAAVIVLTLFSICEERPPTRVYGFIYDGPDIVKEYTPVIARHFDGDKKQEFNTVSKANGSYEFIGLPEGTIQIEASLHGKEGKAWQMPCVELRRGIPQECDIVVPDMGELECIIIGVEDFKKIKVSITSGNYSSRVWNKENTFGVGVGLWCLKAEANGDEIKSVSSVVSKGRKIRLVLDLNKF